MWIKRDDSADKKTMDNPGTYLNHVYTENLKKNSCNLLATTKIRKCWRYHSRVDNTET